MENQRKLVVVISHGADNEKASIAWSIANGGIKNDLDVRIFLVGAGVDWARKGMEKVHLNPLDPTVGEMIRSAVDAGARVGACPPCLGVRGIEEGDLMDYVEVVGSGFIHEVIKEGGAVMNF